MGVGRGKYQGSNPTGPSIGNPNYIPSDVLKKQGKFKDFFYKNIKNTGRMEETRDINPKPDNWKILQAEEHGNYTILKINYPNCTNYEGNKILLYRAKLIDIINQKLIDPHFMDNSRVISPIARFVPTDNGWKMAVDFIKIITEKEND